jgi:PAS domain S-box-containing protein
MPADPSESDILQNPDISPLIQLNSSEFQMILDLLPARIMFKDTQNKILWANRTICESLNRPLKEIQGHLFSDFYSHQINEQSQNLDKEILDTDQPIFKRIMHVAVGEDDENIWLQINRVPFRDEQGTITSILSIATDVSDLRAIQLELEQTTRKFESFMRHSPLMQWAQDTEARYIMVNPAYEKMMQLTAEQIIGKHPSEVHAHHADPDFINLAIQSTLQTLEQNKPLLKEVSININQRLHHLLVTKFVFEMSKGRKAVGGIAVDITDQKNLQDQLMEISTRYELAINGTADGLWDWDMQEYCWYSERFKELLGYKNTDYFSNKLSDSSELIHLDDRKHLWDAIDAHIQHHAVYDIEFRMQCRNGQYRWFRARASATRDASGNAIRMTGSIQDVHDRILAQEQLNQLNQKLEDRVRERTAELAKARDELEVRVRERTAELAHSNKLLSSRNTELDEFAHIAAHDLRSPLRTIAGFGEYLREAMAEWDNPDAHDFLRRILAATGRMEGLINSLLSYSRTGFDELKWTQVDLNILLDEVKGDLSKEINESQTSIIAQSLPAIFGDATMIRQVFQNLLSNAIKYCINSQPQIHITCESDGDKYKLCFKDNGVGFSEKEAQQIFKPFERLHNPSLIKVSGYGVGLSICKRVIERHGGKIQAHSEPGLGAKFCITLPRHHPPMS